MCSTTILDHPRNWASLTAEKTQQQQWISCFVGLEYKLHCLCSISEGKQQITACLPLNQKPHYPPTSAFITMIETGQMSQAYIKFSGFVFVPKNTNLAKWLRDLATFHDPLGGFNGQKRLVTKLVTFSLTFGRMFESTPIQFWRKKDPKAHLQVMSSVSNRSRSATLCEPLFSGENSKLLLRLF